MGGSWLRPVWLKQNGQGEEWQMRGEMWDKGLPFRPLDHCEVAFTLSEKESHWRFCAQK